MQEIHSARRLLVCCVLAGCLAVLCAGSLSAHATQATWPLSSPAVEAFPLADAAWLQLPLAEAAPYDVYPSGPVSHGPIAAKAIEAQPSSPAGDRRQRDQNLTSMFVRDVALDDGSRVAFVSATPLNFQDEHGAWQPIDPRFEAMESGFVNRRNSFEIRAGETKAALKLRQGDAHVGWEPLALAVTTMKDGKSTAADFATPSDVAKGNLADDGRTIVYADSWTLAGLSDEVMASAGAVEHSVVFARGCEPPPLTPTPTLPRCAQYACRGGSVHSLPCSRTLRTGEGRGGGSWLTLRAALHLLPNIQLFANGAVQRAAFESDGDIEMRDARGQTLWVMPTAHAYERANPNERVMARYRLSPQDASTWLVSVDTPLSWWLDEQRNYPVVLDPALAVVRPTDVADIRQIPGCNALPVPLFLPYAGAVGVGINGTCGEVRALVRFNNLTQLSFPPGYTIERAQIVMGATGGQFNNKNGVVFPANTTAHVERIRENWNAGSVSWPGPATDGFYCDTYFTINPPNTPYVGGKPSVQFCDLQSGNSGIITDWLASVNNFGLMIKMGPRTPFGCDGDGCHFVIFPTASSWVSKPRGGYLYDYALEGSGFALVIHYRGPELSNGAPQAVSLPTVGSDYLRTYHGYRFGASALGGQWTAVGVKSVKDFYVNNHLRQVVAGMMDTSLACDGINTICSEVFSPGGNGDQSNFVVGQSGFYNLGTEVRAYPLNNNPSGATSYYVEAARSIDAPVQLPGMDFGDGIVPGTGIVSYTFSFDSYHIITAYNTLVTNNTRVGFKVTYQENNYSFNKPNPFHAYLYKPAVLKEHTRREGIEVVPGVLTPIDIRNGSGGLWGLIVEHAGDITPTPEGCNPTCDAPAQITVTVQLIGCPMNAVPIDDGCEFRKTPTAATQRIAIGNYVVYSENGFVDCADATYWCTYRPPKGSGKVYTPFITWRGRTSRMIAVSGTPIRIKKPPYPTDSDKHLNGFATYVGLVLGTAGDITDGLPLWFGDLDAGFVNDAVNNDGYVRQAYFSSPGVFFNYPAKENNDDIRQVPTVRINAREGFDVLINYAQHVEESMKVKRSIQLSDGSLYDYQFTIGWWLDAATSRDQNLAPYNVGVVRTDPGTDFPRGITIASMNLSWAGTSGAWGMTFDANTQSFTSIYMRNARITHDAKLGGAWNFVRGVILPSGIGPSGGPSACQGHCVTLLANDGSPNWKMPDVNVNNYAKTVMLSQAGELQVFSTDHPLASQRPNVAANFSFRTFGASVEVTEEPCPGSSNPQKVTVIKGSTKLALPGLGSDTDPDQMIASTFTLCESKLHEVSLTFTSEPGIPVAQPPVMFVDMVGGKITINPDYTVVQLQIGFYMGTGLPKIYKGKGTVTIDTRGLFDIQAKGRVMGVMDSTGHLWVAWNPMDLGISAQGYFPREDNWMLKGGWYAHMWRGQGWQHRYNWLPDNDAFHLTASYQAEFRIKKGQIFEWALMDMPPDDISIGVELSFGQFCANSNCTEYQWGIKGKVEIAGFDIGLYLNLECDALKAAYVAPPAAILCFSFILGSDSHILIDQYGGGKPLSPSNVARAQGGGPAQPRSNYQPVNLDVRGVANPSAPRVDQPLTVTTATGSFLVGLTWDRGAPQLSLIRPDNVEISASNAATYGVVVSPTLNAILFGVKNPIAGMWAARISNATPTDNYRLAFFANKRAPVLEFTAPIQSEEVITTTGNSTAPQYYRIRVCLQRAGLSLQRRESQRDCAVAQSGRERQWLHGQLSRELHHACTLDGGAGARPEDLSAGGRALEEDC